jgi:hypothetical protein
MKFNAGKIAHKHIYWDQASLLVQIGLLDPKRIPISGIEQANKLMEIQKGLNHVVMYLLYSTIYSGFQTILYHHRLEILRISSAAQET